MPQNWSGLVQGHLFSDCCCALINLLCPCRPYAVEYPEFIPCSVCSMQPVHPQLFCSCLNSKHHIPGLSQYLCIILVLQSTPCNPVLCTPRTMSLYVRGALLTPPSFPFLLRLAWRWLWLLSVRLDSGIHALGSPCRIARMQKLDDQQQNPQPGHK